MQLSKKALSLFFNDNYRIDAVHRVRRGCEDVIYFTDGINPVRYFNFSKPEDFQDDAGDWDCDLFELFLPYKIPCFQDIQIEQNGVLNPGTHNFSIQYLDEDLNPTEWVYSSQPVDIFHDSLEKKYEFITGSSLYEFDALGGRTLPTTKSILLTLSNLDEKYPFYRIARIEASSFNGTVSKVYASPEIPTSVSQYLVDGNLQGWFEIPVEDIIIKGERIETAQHIEQLENRLLLANTSGKADL